MNYLGILTFLVPCKSKVTQDELFDDPWSVPRTNCSDSSSLIISVKPMSKLIIVFCYQNCSDLLWEKPTNKLVNPFILAFRISDWTQSQKNLQMTSTEIKNCVLGSRFSQGLSLVVLGWIKNIFFIIKKLINFAKLQIWNVKGQLNSEWIYEVASSNKMQTKNYKHFWPTIQTRIVALFLVIFWWV